MKIFVIPGHGAGDPGACGNGYHEAERVRKLAQCVKDLGGDNVILADFKRNYYEDKGISNLTLPKDTQIVELHMDSYSNPSARGAHVIISDKYNPDAYDKALARDMSQLFPGRSESISKRGNLANVNRAAAKGYGYRLIECGFITNAHDIKVFNDNIEGIAKIILKCFGIPCEEKVSEDKPKVSEQIAANMKTIQAALNSLKKLKVSNEISKEIKNMQTAIDRVKKLNG